MNLDLLHTLLVIGRLWALALPLIDWILADEFEQADLERFRTCTVRDLGEQPYCPEVWAAEFGKEAPTEQISRTV